MMFARDAVLFVTYARLARAQQPIAEQGLYPAKTGAGERALSWHAIEH